MEETDTIEQAKAMIQMYQSGYLDGTQHNKKKPYAKQVEKAFYRRYRTKITKHAETIRMETEE